ncbi:glyoxalase family protein [Synechococcus sp. PCC 7335]|uniref:4-hydroxyphenylpyruvate dioxygenase n=1 Tax=Synechococcus sp. (strain ATCC 29403 / PCC 7335) TaxID=91464 RepID=UPI00017EB0F6|nr:4-hydroxyphenylpyruvate dioxygenase [Synechococcus sp. PCC 7335]EDX83703.1 glyoxalase family protein [Synechococcus sp. PCC 7335]
MYFHHLHFYVQDTEAWQKWFSQKLSFNSSSKNSPFEHSEGFRYPCIQPYETLRQGNIEIRLSAPVRTSCFNRADRDPCPVESYLEQHPSGLVDIAFATKNFDAVLRQALDGGARLLEPVTYDESGQRQCQINGWAHLRHTLVEVSSQWTAAQKHTELPDSIALVSGFRSEPKLSDIDHVVINVPQDELHAAAGWYQEVFGMVLGQQFDIQTARSGLHSQVLVHPDGPLQLPINEPSSPNSQIQEFLLHNRGAGVQHVALRSGNAVDAIAHFRAQGLNLLDVPSTYYDSLHQRQDCPIKDLSAISRQQLLIDWPQGGQQGLLLQTFTQPIFEEPTFFFEIIERRGYIENGQLKAVKGFGEGNFQALFEAIERSQLEREGLPDKDEPCK